MSEDNLSMSEENLSRRDIVMRYFDEQREENEKIVREGIEKYRKGNCTVEVISDGKAPERIAVEAEQTSHAFKFGANLFMLDEFEDEWKNDIYKEKFSSLFNLATLPFYWDATEPQRGVYRFDKDSPRMYRRPPIDLCLEYCEAHGIEPKLHCLNYDTLIPDWAQKLSVPEMKEALTERFRVISERYAGRIPSMEVTNETLQMWHKSPFFMEDDFVEWSFEQADKFFPNNKLIINDYNVWDPAAHTRNYYYMQIDRLLRSITHLDSIGLQFHCFFPEEAEIKQREQKFNPRRLRELYDLFSRLGKKIQITEMTIPARSVSPKDEELQAELTTELYKVMFSHPSMEAIIYWNLVDGYGYMPNGGEPGDMTKGENIYYGAMLRFDMTEKPVYRALYDLINKQWHTSEKIVSHGGAATFRGFYGDYDIKVYADGKVVPAKVSLRETGENKIRIKI